MSDDGCGVSDAICNFPKLHHLKNLIHYYKVWPVTDPNFTFYPNNAFVFDSDGLAICSENRQPTTDIGHRASST